MSGVGTHGAVVLGAILTGKQDSNTRRNRRPLAAIAASPNGIPTEPGSIRLFLFAEYHPGRCRPGEEATYPAKAIAQTCMSIEVSVTKILTFLKADLSRDYLKFLLPKGVTRFSSASELLNGDMFQKDKTLCFGSAPGLKDSILREIPYRNVTDNLYARIISATNDAFFRVHQRCQILRVEQGKCWKPQPPALIIPPSNLPHQSPPWVDVTSSPISTLANLERGRSRTHRPLVPSIPTVIDQYPGMTDRTQHLIQQIANVDAALNGIGVSIPWSRPLVNFPNTTLQQVVVSSTQKLLIPTLNRTLSNQTVPDEHTPQAGRGRGTDNQEGQKPSDNSQNGPTCVRNNETDAEISEHFGEHTRRSSSDEKKSDEECLQRMIFNHLTGQHEAVTQRMIKGHRHKNCQRFQQGRSQTSRNTQQHGRTTEDTPSTGKQTQQRQHSRQRLHQQQTAQAGLQKANFNQQLELTKEVDSNGTKSNSQDNSTPTKKGRRRNYRNRKRRQGRGGKSVDADVQGLLQDACDVVADTGFNEDSLVGQDAKVNEPASLVSHPIINKAIEVQEVVAMVEAPLVPNLPCFYNNPVMASLFDTPPMPTNDVSIINIAPEHRPTTTQRNSETSGFKVESCPSFSDLGKKFIPVGTRSFFVVSSPSFLKKPSLFAPSNITTKLLPRETKMGRPASSVRAHSRDTNDSIKDKIATRDYAELIHERFGGTEKVDIFDSIFSKYRIDKSINELSAVLRIANLFHGFPSYIDGFNIVLPRDCKVNVLRNARARTYRVIFTNDSDEEEEICRNIPDEEAIITTTQLLDMVMEDLERKTRSGDSSYAASEFGRAVCTTRRASAEIGELDICSASKNAPARSISRMTSLEPIFERSSSRMSETKPVIGRPAFRTVAPLPKSELMLDICCQAVQGPPLSLRASTTLPGRTSTTRQARELSHSAAINRIASRTTAPISKIGFAVENETFHPVSSMMGSTVTPALQLEPQILEKLMATDASINTSDETTSSMPNSSNCIEVGMKQFGAQRSLVRRKLAELENQQHARQDAFAPPINYNVSFNPPNAPLAMRNNVADRLQTGQMVGGKVLESDFISTNSRHHIYPGKYTSTGAMEEGWMRKVPKNPPLMFIPAQVRASIPNLDQRRGF